MRDGGLVKDRLLYVPTPLTKQSGQGTSPLGWQHERRPPSGRAVQMVRLCCPVLHAQGHGRHHQAVRDMPGHGAATPLVEGPDQTHSHPPTGGGLSGTGPVLHGQSTPPRPGARLPCPVCGPTLGLDGGLDPTAQGPHGVALDMLAREWGPFKIPSLVTSERGPRLPAFNG
jgi:hypothetical protein